jgi:putative hydrolase
MLTSLDLFIAGFHEPVFPPQDKATHTEAMIATMARARYILLAIRVIRNTPSIFRR